MPGQWFIEVNGAGGASQFILVSAKEHRDLEQHVANGSEGYEYTHEGEYQGTVTFTKYLIDLVRMTQTNLDNEPNTERRLLFFPSDTAHAMLSPLKK